MTTQELTTAKAEYSRMAGIYNRNLIKIRRQLNSQELKDLKAKFSPSDDNHLAKILMLRGIEL